MPIDYATLANQHTASCYDSVVAAMNSGHIASPDLLSETVCVGIALETDTDLCTCD